MSYPPELRWFVYPARHSVAFVPFTDPAAPDFAGIRYLVPEDNGCVAPGEIPLLRHFSTDELAELFDQRAVSATAFGPPQDKAANEDFALSAIIATEGRSYAFAAVADGVSRRTFWAARTARIAALTAYWSIASELAGHADLADDTAPQTIVERMAADIREALLADRAMLTRIGAVPADWSEAVYRRRAADTSMWYRSTLLVAVIGADGGFIAAAGDGGLRAIIERRKGWSTTFQETALLKSVEGEPLKHFVDDTLSAARFQIYRINTADGRQATHILMASDGIDTTLQKLAPDQIAPDNTIKESAYRQLPLSSRPQAQAFLSELSRLPETAIDNLSIARATWPTPKAPAEWRAWPKADLLSALKVEAARQREAPPVPKPASVPPVAKPLPQPVAAAPTPRTPQTHAETAVADQQPPPPSADYPQTESEYRRWLDSLARRPQPQPAPAQTGPEPPADGTDPGNDKPADPVPKLRIES